MIVANKSSTGNYRHNLQVLSLLPVEDMKEDEEEGEEEENEYMYLPVMMMSPV